MPMPPRTLLAGLALLAGARVSAQQPAAPPARDTAPRAAMVEPAADQARGVDAELRAALFELVTDRPLTALDRLEGLRALGDSALPPPARTERGFLLAESYYRLGMRAAFDTAAAALGAQAPPRYAELLSVQRMMVAYRQGDDARVRQLAAALPASSASPLASMLTGLSAYRQRDWTGARDAFAAVRAAGGPYAPYAQYMGALAQLGGDTTRAGAVLDTLRSLAGVATGRFGDQVRLTAAQLAYEAGRYPDAATFAGAVAPASGLAAQALLTRAWALYRSRQFSAADSAFAAFATRYPDLPQRDVARLMVGQALLEAGRTGEAGRYLAALADSMAVESTTLHARASGALADAARALVQARVAGVMFLPDVRAGQTLVLSDHAGADASSLLAAVAGTPAPPVRAGPEVLSLDAVRARLDSLGPGVDGAGARRLVFARSPAGAPDGWTEAEQTLTAADMSLALARYRLQEQRDAQGEQIAAMQALQRLIARDDTVLARGAAVLSAMQDSLSQMDAALTAARERMRAIFTSQVRVTTTMASRNASLADSLRATLQPYATPEEASTLQLESQTAAIYARVAAAVQAGAEAAIGRHPVFAMRDSLAARVAASRVLHGDAQRVLAADSMLAVAELARLQGRDTPGVRAMRATVAAAEARQGAAASAVVALVNGELTARATALLAELERERERAAYGSASAAFFEAMEAAGAGTVPATASTAPSSPPR